MLLDQLKKALEPLVELSRAETSFDVLGTTVHLRLLSPDEELQCQQEAQQFISEVEDDDEVEDLSRTRAIRFLDGFRLSILSRAIVQINDLDLRDMQYIETGEVLPNGVKVKVLKTQAVRDIIIKFPRQIQVFIMQKFHILTESVNVVVDENLDNDFSDDDAEVQAMEEELQRKKNAINTKKEAVQQDDVRKLMRTTANQSESYTNERLNTAKDIEKTSKEAFQEAEKEVFEEEPQEEIIERTRTRTPITPTQATPPSVGSQPPPSRTEPEEQLQVQESPKAESNIFQEQEMPPQRPKPNGLQEGIEVYRLPTQSIGGEQTTTKNTPTTDSRNPRFRPPQK